MDSLLSDSFHLDDLMPLIRESLETGRPVILPPRGTSMLPLLRQGIDSVRLSPVPDKLKKYDLPLYQRGGGQYVLHRIVDVNGTYTCIGDNQFVLEPGVRQDQMIAVVTHIFRGNREIPVTGIGYRLYCRFWHYTRFIRKIYRGCKERLRRLLK